MEIYEIIIWSLCILLGIYTFRKQWRAMNTKQMEHYPTISLTVIANMVHFAPKTPHEKNIVLNKLIVAVLIATGFITGWLWIFSILALIAVVWHLDWFEEEHENTGR